MLLKEIGRLIAVLDSSSWINTPKKESLDFSAFWRKYSKSFENIVNGNYDISLSEYQQRRLKIILNNERLWKSDMQLIKKLYVSNNLTINDIAFLFKGYQEELENIYMAEDLASLKEKSNLTASEISDLMNVNKNSILAWVSHKRNIPKQAYKEACEKLKNFR